MIYNKQNPKHKMKFDRVLNICMHKIKYCFEPKCSQFLIDKINYPTAPVDKLILQIIYSFLKKKYNPRIVLLVVVQILKKTKQNFGRWSSL